MLLYFKKRKFRKFIKKCGILEDQEVIALSNKFKQSSTSNFKYTCDLYSIKGLKEWELDILYEEIKKSEDEKDRKKFFDTWTRDRKKFFDTWTRK